MSGEFSFFEAKLEERQAVCDRCGRVDRVDKMIVLQVGPEFYQYIEICRPCLNKGSGVGKK
ncbi:MAG: hypothetical protein QXY54_05085 [Nitrososphaerota archaeon]